jgi:EpsI family protein
MSIGRWQGRHESLEDVYQETLAFDDYVLANYRTGEGALVNLYSAYYSSQRTGRSAHSPRACLPGGGWRILSLERQDIPVPGRAVPLPANRVVIELGGQRQVVYYWFQQRGRTLTNEYLVKWYIFQDALFRNRTDGALVRLTGFVTDEASEEDADAAVRAFAADLVPLLDRYVPG